MYFSYLIVDPKASSELQLHNFLEEYGEFQPVGRAENAEEGLNQILKFSPELVFVNLQGEPQSYFHMVSELHQYLEKLPLFIAISETKAHAYDAIKNNFFDYWLFPFNEFDIRKTLLKLRKIVPQPAEPTTILLKSYKDFRYINTDEIMYLQADNNTTDFHLLDGSVISAYKTLKTFEKSLPANFIRVHQSFILNKDYVTRINYGKSLCSLKTGKDQLPFSRSYRENIDALKELLSKNAIRSSH